MILTEYKMDESEGFCHVRLFKGNELLENKFKDASELLANDFPKYFFSTHMTVEMFANKAQYRQR